LDTICASFGILGTKWVLYMLLSEFKESRILDELMDKTSMFNFNPNSYQKIC
jgi:hypothetical protein